MRTITLEEHFISPGFLAGPGKDFTERLRIGTPRRQDLRAASGYRRQAHRGDGRRRIDMQVLSLNAPGVEQAEAAEPSRSRAKSNDFLAER